MDEPAADRAETEQIQALLGRFEIPLLQFATRITGDRERARDVVQETFVKYQRNGASANHAQPATWLFTVCRNGALNVCRKEKRMMFLDEQTMESWESEQPLPREQLEQKEAAGFLLKIVATLPPRQQEVIQLKFQNDLSYEQIAEITKTTANNVGVLIHTALKTLRQRYTQASKEFIAFTPRTT
ncbi:MAG: polymerase sigma factor, sigma-70 family [Spartobacteria bacterium]|nr:polymerase sigma factor, sigma-70 family [Spartobacteria bacterium]